VINLKNSIACTTIPTARKVDAYCHIGSCYEKLNKLDEAQQIYLEALSISPQNFKTLEFLGWVFFLKHDYTESVSYFSKALELASDNSAEVGDIHYLLGRVYLEMENYTEGQNSFQRAIYKNSNAYLYWSSIGILYAKAMQPQDAFECFVKASNISQDVGEVWFNMAILYEQCNQKQEAILAYQRAISLDENNGLAVERKGKLQRNEEMGALPSYVHPPFELSEVPFSVKRNDKGIKQMKNLPDINNIKKEKVEIKDDEKESSDEEYVDEKSGESESNGSSPYSPCGTDIKPRVISKKATRSFTHSQVIEEPRRRRTSTKALKQENKSIKIEETLQNKPIFTPEKLNPSHSENPNFNNLNSGFTLSSASPNQSMPFFQTPLINPVPQTPNTPFTSRKIPGSTIPRFPFQYDLSVPNPITNPLEPIPCSKNPCLGPMNRAKLPPGFENFFNNIPQSPAKVPQEAANPYPSTLNIAKMPPGTEGMEFFRGAPQSCNIPPQPPANMFPSGLPNMSMMMNMMPSMMPSQLNNNKQSQQNFFNAYQMAMQTMILNQMPGMMMNPMMGLMNLRMMGNKPPGPISKKDSEEDLAETLTKLNESAENDEDGLRKKRKGDKSKDLTIKKRKK
jgi:tetratricopeptide (TPR) repeat protein